MTIIRRHRNALYLRRFVRKKPNIYKLGQKEVPINTRKCLRMHAIVRFECELIKSGETRKRVAMYA